MMHIDAELPEVYNSFRVHAELKLSEILFIVWYYEDV